MTSTSANVRNDLSLLQVTRQKYQLLPILPLPARNFLNPPSDIPQKVRVDNDKAVNPGKVQELMEYGSIDFYARRS
jgi:hypothetical protein